MPLMERKEIGKVAKVVKILSKCSSSDAAKAADKICRDPEAVELLGIACGLSVGAVGVSGRTTIATAAVQAWPLAITSGIMTGVGGYAAQRFCIGVVRQTGNNIPFSLKNGLKSLDK